MLLPRSCLAAVAVGVFVTHSVACGPGSWGVPQPGAGAAAGAAPTEAQAEAQPAQTDPAAAMTLDNVCESITNAYSARCNITPEMDQGRTYAWCIGGGQPADNSVLNYGQTAQCMADIGVSDCNVMQQGSLPPTCGQQAAPSGEAADPGGVTVAQACDRLMEEHCNKCVPQDMAACVQNSLVWCYHDRDANRGTGMSSQQYKRCKQTYLKLACDAAESGYVPMDCPGLR